MLATLFVDFLHINVPNIILFTFLRTDYFSLSILDAYRKIIVELIISPSSVILPYRLISYAIPSSHTACVARSTKSACG
jgi:hypothetical protein